MKPSSALQGSSRETKFRIPISRAPMVEDLLDAFLQRHTTIPPSHVNSIYYDTENLDALYEKVDGDYDKTRFRLRWYDPVDDRSVTNDLFVQVKRRLGSHRTKEILLAVETKHQVAELPLDSIELRSLASYFARLDPIRAALLVPVIRTRYFRKRYHDPCSGAELCLDRDLQVMALNPGLGTLDPTARLDFAIMEIKLSDGALPIHVEKLVRDVAYPEAISKYAAAMQCRLNP